MSRIIKVSSRQGNQPSIAQPLVDFDIPSGQYDLSKSYFVLNSSAPSANQNNISLLNISTRDAGGNVDAQMRDSVVFVRHAKLRSSTNGQIENNRHINTLRLNQKCYEQTLSNIRSQALMTGLETHKSVNNLKASHYRSINKLGTTSSSDKSHNYIIRMKDVLPFCSTDYYDTDDKGDLSVGLELNLGRADGTSAFAITQELGAGSAVWTHTFNGGEANRALADVAGAGAINTIATKRVYNNLDQSPYYVGQRLTITSAQLANSPEQRQITQIARNANNTLQLTFDANLTFNNNANDITAVGVADASVGNAPTFNFMELVLHQVPKQDPRDYQYTTYKLQEDTVATQALNKTYMISPMCKNVYVITPDDNTELLSNTVVNSYRFAVDNVLQSNRAIQFGNRADSLHDLQVIKTYDNKDVPLKSLTGKLLGVAPATDDDGGNAFGRSYMVMNPTPITDKPKLLGLELNTGANLGRVMIYEEEVKML